MANITTTGFATQATKHTPSNDINSTTFLGGKALYAGASGDIRVIMAGITEDADGSALSASSADKK